MANHNLKSVRAMLGRAESATSTKVGELRKGIAELDARERELSAELVEVASRPSDIRQAWSRGDDIPAIDYVEAEANIERVEAMLSGVRQRAAKLEKQILPTSCDVAEAMVPAVKRALPGVEVFATFAPSDAWETIPESLYPTAVIAQTEATRANHEAGAASGKVEIHYYRTKAHRPLDLREIEASVSDSATSLRAGQNRPARMEGASTGVDRLKLDVFNVFGELPLLASIDERNAKGFSLVAATPFVNAEAPRIVGGGLTQTAQRWEARAGHFALSGGAPRLTERTDGNVRTVELTETLGLHVLKGELADLEYRLRVSAERQIGQALGGLGRCESVTLAAQARESSASPYYPVALTATFTSTVA